MGQPPHPPPMKITYPRDLLGGRSLEQVLVDGNTTSIGEQLTGVVEDDHAIAQQTPTPLRMERDQTRRVVIGSVRGRTPWLMLTHCRISPSSPVVVESRTAISMSLTQ